MTDQSPPHWKPLSWLPVIAGHIDGMVEADGAQYTQLQTARATPWLLDDATVQRVIAVFTAQQADLGLFDEQIRRWTFDNCTPAQRREVDRLAGQMTQLRTINTAMLALAAELQAETIETQLAKSDVELGLEFLLKGWPGGQGPSHT
ncbi:MAG: hypothetical protein M3Z04_06175 [Chloroflexota bacterium]|nr:hypothetical protein [Chloroflexota bacterium]